MFKKIDRYIITELLAPFFFGMAAFSAILAGGTVLFPLVSESVKLGLPIGLVAKIFFYKLPTVIVFTFPMSMLLASILAFGRLSSDQEITAFRAAGISVNRLVLPVAVAGLMISFLTIWFNESIVPKTSYYAEEMLIRAAQQDKPKIQKNVNMTEYDSEGLPIRVINVMEVEGNQLKGITVAEYDSGQLTRLVRAKTGRWLESGAWEFYDGVMHSFPKNESKKLYIIQFEKEMIHVRVSPLDLTKREKRVEEMNAQDLLKRIEKRRKVGEDPTSDLVNLHLKIAVPFTSLLFAVLGASVGIRPNRSSSALGLGMSLVIIIIYYLLYSVGMGLGLSKAVSPVLAAWMPNIIVGIAAIYLLKRVTS